jgi:alkaline phosphatase
MGSRSFDVRRGYTGTAFFDLIFIDLLPVGNVRAHSANDMVTDSAAAVTALATGVETYRSQH